MPEPYGETVARVDRSDRQIRRLSVTVLILGAAVYILAALSIHNDLAHINRDEANIAARQVTNGTTIEADIAAVNREVGCQDMAFDRIVAYVNAGNAHTVIRLPKC